MNITPHEDPYKKVMEQLLHYCHKKSYPPKTVVFRPGDLGDRLYYIVDGSVSICVEDDENDQELVLAYLNNSCYAPIVEVNYKDEYRTVRNI